MKPTEQNTKAPVAATGCFAMLGGMFHARGSGAPKIAHHRLVVPVALAALALALVAAPARAAVVHEFIGTEEPSAYTPFPGVGGTVVKDESTSLSDWAKGDIYELVETSGYPVGSGYAGEGFDVFNPARELVGELRLPGSEAPDYGVYEMAIDDVNGDVIVDGQTHTVGDALDLLQPTLPGEWSAPLQVASPVGRTRGIGVDESVGSADSGEFFVGEGSKHIEEYGPMGTHLSTIVGACKNEGETPPCGQEDLVPFGELRSVSVNPATHDIYVESEVDEETKERVVDILGPDAIAPDVTTGAVSQLKGTSVTLNGTVNPLGEGPASCQFAWGTAGEFGHTVACSGEVGEGDSPVAVRSLGLEGLSPDTEYCYLLQARNKAKGSNPGGFNGGEESQDHCFTTPGAADVHASASEVTADSALLDAEVDPRGAPTRYYFQYGAVDTERCAAEPSLCGQAPAAPGASVGSGQSPTSGTQPLQGLTPETLYHYRVLEVREAEPGQVEEYASADHTFTTQRPGTEFALPDGRQYELVSPPQKQGALFMGDPLEKGMGARGCHEGEHCRIQAATSGDALADEAQQPSERGAAGNANSAMVLMTRAAGGWSARVISTPHLLATGAALGAPGPEYALFSEDLSHAAFGQWGDFDPLSPEAVEQTPYLRTNYLNGDVDERCEAPDLSAGSCYRPLVTRANTAPGTVFGDEYNGECPYIDCGPQVVAATRDLSHVIVASREPLTAEPVVVSRGVSQSLAEPALYEWYQGRLRLLDVLPGRTAGGEMEISWRRGDAEHVVSADGDRVILEGVNAQIPSGHFYVRDVAKGETVELPGIYATANDEDTRIFTVDNGALDECALTEVAGQDACKTTDLTPEADGEPPNVESVLGASEDGSYVYFAAGGKLAPGASAKDVCAPNGIETGPCNLYVYHDGATRFVAELSFTDLDLYLGSSTEQGGYVRLRARVSPDGHWLAFMSDRELTGYDNHDANSGEPDEEVYLYHAGEAPASEAGTLSCASCDPTGARPVGLENAVPDGPAWAAASLPSDSERVQQRALEYQPRYLSDSGRLFFDSKDALVPLDVNGTIDVYEYEPQGVPSGEHGCSPQSASASAAFKPARGFEAEGVAGEEAAGCVALISSGASAQPSAFLDASETGGDVFFVTAAKLSSQDLEGGLSIYDAQECTSALPCSPPPAVIPPPCGNAESCRSAPQPQPEVFGAPSSATFSGPGNLAAPPPAAVKPKAKAKTVKCKRGDVKSKQGRCVKKPKKKKKKNKAKKSAHINRRAPR